MIPPLRRRAGGYRRSRGHALVAFLALPAVAANIRDGSLRALAVSSAKRSVEFPDVPTLTEAGFPNQESVPRRFASDFCFALRAGARPAVPTPPRSTNVIRAARSSRQPPAA
jgi:hypothetical protein